MALPATDNFNRADGALGANWSLQPDPPTIVSNAARPAAGGFGVAFWSADVFGNDQYSQAQLGSNAQLQYSGVVVRASGTGAVNAYVLYCNSTDVFIAKWVAGSFSLLQTIAGEATIQTVYKLTVEGTTLKAYKAGVQIGTNQTDSSLTSGSAGIFGFTNDPRIDDWEGGNVSAAGGGVPRVINQYRRRR